METIKPSAQPKQAPRVRAAAPKLLTTRIEACPEARELQQLAQQIHAVTRRAWHLAQISSSPERAKWFAELGRNLASVPAAAYSALRWSLDEKDGRISGFHADFREYSADSEAEVPDGSGQ